jgi:hypothetical protein
MTTKRHHNWVNYSKQKVRKMLNDDKLVNTRHHQSKVNDESKEQVFLRLNNMEMKLLPNFFFVSLLDATSAGGSRIAKSEEDV